jgi:type IV secretory pathway VirB9-like protein
MRASSLTLSVVLLPIATGVLAAQATGIRDVSASERSVTPVATKLRYTTMIVLPEQDEIVDVVCGDRDFWVISVTQNIAHVKPAKQGGATNLNLVTTSGAVYSFLLSESSAAPDLKLYVTGDPSTARSKPKFYSAAHVEALQAQLAESQVAIDAAQRRADEGVATFKRHYPTQLQFAFGTVRYERPFYVRSIWHDGQFTYIRSEASELPALYELKDGQPALVNFQVENGTYIVPKVLERGYLALGKERFHFGQEQ